MTYKFGVYGDSIAFGYGNDNQSWFDLISVNSKSIKFAQNGETIGNVLEKIKKDTNTYDTLYFAVGVNDLLLSSPKTNQTAFSNLITQYEEILKIAKLKAKKIIVQSILPIREKLFPNQEWLDTPKWCFNTDIIKFNKQLNELCIKSQFEYFDLYSEFSSENLADIYIDAVHLNKFGQERLANIYMNKLQNSEESISDLSRGFASL